jgi:hypothetical protein
MGCRPMGLFLLQHLLAWCKIGFPRLFSSRLSGIASNFRILAVAFGPLTLPLAQAPPMLGPPLLQM